MPNTRTIRILGIVAICAQLAISQSQPNPEPIRLKFISFSRVFFQSHRTNVLRQWHEHYRNPNSELEGEWHTELHRGYRFEFIRGDGYKTDELGCLVINDPSIRLPLGISLGDTKEKVINLLGKPDTAGNESIEYELSGDMCMLVFRFTQNRLIEIEISIDHE